MPSIQRRNLLLLPLLSAAALAYTGAFLLRFEFALPSSVEGLFRLGLSIFIPVKAIVYWSFRLQAIRWRQAGLFDLNRIAIANITASAVASAVASLGAGPAFPRSIFIIDAALCLLATACMHVRLRLFWRVLV